MINPHCLMPSRGLKSRTQLVPRSSVRARRGGAGTCKQSSRRGGAEERLIEMHVAFRDTSAGDNLDRLRRSLAILRHVWK